MDCRKFYKNLEDYLEDGLDFPGRFGMERHAQQCIACGKVMSDAQQLRRIAKQLERVKAPANFELQVLAELRKEKAFGRFSALRRFWLYGFQIPSARKLAWASSLVVVLALGIFYLYPYLYSPRGIKLESPSSPVEIAKEPAAIPQSPKILPVVNTTALEQPVRPVLVEASKPAGIRKDPEPLDPDMEQMVDREVTESDYVEFRVTGPDNRPVSVRWPSKSRMRYGQTPEEYFIRNVSH